jgi:hypothetical protein
MFAQPGSALSGAAAAIALPKVTTECDAVIRVACLLRRQD